MENYGCGCGCGCGAAAAAAAAAAGTTCAPRQHCYGSALVLRESLCLRVKCSVLGETLLEECCCLGGGGGANFEVQMWGNAPVVPRLHEGVGQQASYHAHDHGKIPVPLPVRSNRQEERGGGRERVRKRQRQRVGEGEGGEEDKGKGQGGREKEERERFNLSHWLTKSLRLCVCPPLPLSAADTLSHAAPSRPQHERSGEGICEPDPHESHHSPGGTCGGPVARPTEREERPGRRHAR